MMSPGGCRHRSRTETCLGRIFQSPLPSMPDLASSKHHIPHPDVSSCSIVGILEQHEPSQPTQGRKVALVRYSPTVPGTEITGIHMHSLTL